MSADSGKPRCLPVFLSAFVYPGAGQLAQRRWAAAGVFVLLFTVFFVTLAVSVLGPLVRNLTAVMGWDFSGSDVELEVISLPLVLGSFAGALIVYALNLADVVRASRRVRPVPPPL